MRSDRPDSKRCNRQTVGRGIGETHRDSTEKQLHRTSNDRHCHCHSRCCCRSSPCAFPKSTGSAAPITAFFNAYALPKSYELELELEMIRSCRARKWDLPAAYNQWKVVLVWRRDVRVYECDEMMASSLVDVAAPTDPFICCSVSRSILRFPIVSVMWCALVSALIVVTSSISHLAFVSYFSATRYAADSLTGG